MPNLSRFAGIPFQPFGCGWQGCDGWGLVRLVYAETLGVALPALVPEAEGEDPVGLFLQGWREAWLTSARPLDVLILGDAAGGRRGVAIVAGAGRMLRTGPGEVATLPLYPTLRWPVLGCRRHPGMTGGAPARRQALEQVAA